MGQFAQTAWESQIEPSAGGYFLKTFLDRNQRMADRLDSLAEVICFAAHDIDRQVFYARVQIRSRKRERSLSDPSIAIDKNLPARRTGC